MGVDDQVPKKQKVEPTLEDVEMAPPGSAGTDGETISGGGGASSGAVSNPEDEPPAGPQLRDAPSGGGGVSSLTVTNLNKDLSTEPLKLSFKVCSFSLTGQPCQH